MASISEKVKTFASTLSGGEYPFALTQEQAAKAKELNLVVVYGASDDLMEFEGAIYDEVPCYEGGVALLDEDGQLLVSECENESCPYAEKAKAKAVEIQAMWAPTAETSWEYRTTIPHATFDVLEDGDVYCRGIVFSLEDAKAAWISKNKS